MVSMADHTAMIVMTAIRTMYRAIAFGPYLGRSAVAMRGENPPATAADNWAPSEAPLYRTLVPKSSEKNAPCGAYIGACEQRNTSSSARITSGVDCVSNSQNSGN